MRRRADGGAATRALATMVLGVALGAGVLVPGPAGAGAASNGGTFTDHPVRFQAGGMTVYGIYRGPSHPRGTFPAVLLIAGSGPTDENGNSPEIAGPVDTLKTLADWLSADGVASLRYDKLGTGRTGAGIYALDPSALGIGPYEEESAAALSFLARQPGVDRHRLGVFGHSEGALFALLLATGKAGPAPPVHALGLLEPLSRRYLDVISEQVEGQVAAQLKAGTITAAVAATVTRDLTAAVASLRTTGTVAAGLPYGLSSLLSPTTARFLSEADRYDPATLGAELPAGTPVLVSCSDADIQVTCADVAHLRAGLAAGHADVDAVVLHGVDHVLKVDDSMTAADYGKDLPFSPQLRLALAAFVRAHLS